MKVTELDAVWSQVTDDKGNTKVVPTAELKERSAKTPVKTPVKTKKG